MVTTLNRVDHLIHTVFVCSPTIENINNFTHWITYTVPLSWSLLVYLKISILQLFHYSYNNLKNTTPQQHASASYAPLETWLRKTNICQLENSCQRVRKNITNKSVTLVCVSRPCKHFIMLINIMYVFYLYSVMRYSSISSFF